MEELQTIGKYMQFTKVEEGDVVFKEGDKGTYICFVAYGSLSVLKASEGGGSVAIATLHKGRSIGEMAVIDESPRSATVKARTKATLIMIRQKEFNLILENNSMIGIKILKGITRLLSHGLRKTSSRLADYMLPLG